jgi:uncharacterized membrane protein
VKIRGCKQSLCGAIYIFLVTASCLIFNPSSAVASTTFNQILMTLVKYNLLDESLHNDSDLGRKFCEALGGRSCYLVNSFGEGVCKSGSDDSCYRVSSLGEGICKAGGGDSCYLVSTIGEGICKGGGGTSCYLVSSIGEGICKASQYKVTIRSRVLCRKPRYPVTDPTGSEVAPYLPRYLAKTSSKSDMS